MTAMSGSKAHRFAVATTLNDFAPAKILDVCCGDGWLTHALTYPAVIDGIDFYALAPKDYNHFVHADFNLGVPDELPSYDAIVCCEAMGYLQNPGGFVQSVRRHLNSHGRFVLSIPNPNYVGARVNHLIQGYPRSYSWFAQNDTPEPHMPWLSLGLFQLWLLLGLNGFDSITVHEVDEPKPRRVWEYGLGWLVKNYARRQLRKADSEALRRLWSQACSDQVVYGRQLVISAVAKY
jgi:SAM-dependent methyltransferase